MTTQRQRGYFGIGIYGCKKEINVGGLFRSAQAFGANFIYTIGHRYTTQSSDISKAYRHIPLYQYETFNQFYNTIPKECSLIGVEYPHKNARTLYNFIHPERSMYLLGAEDTGIPEECLEKCHSIVYVDGSLCLNVATAGGIIMYDRRSKLYARKEGFV